MTAPDRPARGADNRNETSPSCNSCATPPLPPRRSPSCRAALGGPRKIAPSDRVNIAAVGVGGMGRANLQALVEPEHRRAVRRGLELRRRALRRHPEADREARRSALHEATDAAQRERALQQIEGLAGAAAEAPQGEALHRLPRDAREAEEHRRGGHRHARSHACAHRARRHGSRQTRVRAEAARLVGGGMPPARASAPPRPNYRPRWATRATPPTMRGW